MKENLITIGESIFNAPKIITKAGHEISGLLEYLSKAFQEKIVNINDIKSFIEDEDEYDDKWGYDEWVCLGIICNYKILLKSKKKPSAYIAIQITLSSDDEELPAGKQPLLHVLFSSEAWAYDDFQLSPSYEEEGYKYKLIENCLWEYLPKDTDKDPETDWLERTWGFSLPLVELNTHQDLNAQIIESVVTLIQGKSPKEAFKNADKVLRFKFNETDKLVLLNT